MSPIPVTSVRNTLHRIVVCIHTQSQKILRRDNGGGAIVLSDEERSQIPEDADHCVGGRGEEWNDMRHFYMTNGGEPIEFLRDAAHGTEFGNRVV
jgi:hypothetical protein